MVYKTTVYRAMKTDTSALPLLKAVKVLDRLRERVRYLRYSLRTERAYVYWVRHYVPFHGLRHPADMGVRRWRRFCPG